MATGKPHSFRGIPSVEILTRDFETQNVAPGVPRKVLVQLVRETVRDFRAEFSRGAKLPSDGAAVRKELLRRTLLRAEGAARPHYGRAVNATGIILHTGLGRAVLPSAAVEQIKNELAGYSRLQQDVESGKRSRRDEGIERLLRQLTGAEAATVVNNNAAATMIVLNTLAKGKEAIVSRGQLIEIGGEFRLPDVMAASGVRLVEVGTTNRTHARDYEQAITENTAAILRVHPSNFRIAGFTAEVPAEELVKIAHRNHVLMIDDLGAGALMDFSRYGFQKEPTLAESIRTGADVVLSSADKLVGGPQGGLILGREKLIAAIRKNPLARILRVGKLTLAALEATLKLFLDESRACQEVPTLQMLSRTPSQLATEAGQIVKALQPKIKNATLTAIPGMSQMGGGSLPGQSLPTTLVAIQPKKASVEELAAGLRAWAPPVFARIHQDQLLIDPRTLLKDDAEIIIRALAAVLD